MDASELFENSIAWLKENYAQFQFFVERDVVWTIQKYLIRQIKEQSLPFRVFNDYPILSGNRRSICVDLAILNMDNLVEVAAEFKYEPSHERKYKASQGKEGDIWHTKFGPTVVFWGDDGVGKDIKRIQNYVDIGKAKAAYAVFIDEGSHFSSKLPHHGSEWIHWNTQDISSQQVALLWSRKSST